MRIITVALLLLFLFGCSAALKTTSRITYTRKEFTVQKLRTGGLAILPVVASSGLEAHKQSFDEALVRYIGKPDMAYSSPGTTLDILNRYGLAEGYNSMVLAYGKTSVLDREILSRLGSTLHCLYLLHIVLTDFSQERDYGTSAISGYIQTYRSEGLAANAQLWDVESGDVVWSAYGEAKRKEDEFVGIRSKAVWEYTEPVVKELVTKLFGISVPIDAKPINVSHWVTGDTPLTMQLVAGRKYRISNTGATLYYTNGNWKRRWQTGETIWITTSRTPSVFSIIDKPSKVTIEEVRN